MENLKLMILNNIKRIILVLIAIIMLIIMISYLLKDNNQNEEIQEEIVLLNDNQEEETIELIEEEPIEYIYVDIKGYVKSPGVYKIEKKADKRVNDLIKYAGGLNSKADTSVINLSMKLYDQMVVIIYSKDQVKNYRKTKEEEKEKLCICEQQEQKNDACIQEEVINQEDNINSENDNKEIQINDTSLININFASKEELMSISGIGESKAISIIAYREEIGLFTKIEDIMNVSGIGESLYNKIKNFITV